MYSQSGIYPSSEFQSTLSVRRATWKFNADAPATVPISIHALRKESDLTRRGYGTCPRFQSTLSVRRATEFRQTGREQGDISIHALRKESDANMMQFNSSVNVFQSTLSVRRATFFDTAY